MLLVIFGSWIGMIGALLALVMVGALALFAALTALTVISLLVGALTLPANKTT